MKFSHFRVIFGSYLAIHFLSLIPYGPELFGNDMPFDYKLNPTYHVFPNILNIDFVANNVQVYLLFLAGLSALYTFGSMKYFKWCSLILWYGWASLLNRNFLIYNPGIPYIGYILLASMFVVKDRNGEYNLPYAVFWFSWLLMGLGYTVSGLHKLQSPSWIDGTALLHVLNAPLARDNIIRDLLVSLPLELIKLMTWGSLALEILALPLGMFKNTRMLFWWAFIFFHLGILATINFTDLTVGVMMIHLFVLPTKI